MRHSPLSCVVLLALTASWSAACHRSRPRTASAPTSWPEESHCWWAALRTPIPADSVAVRYARAFATLGLSGTRWSRQGDTAWAEGGPTVLSRPAGNGVYAARVVAFRRGDTTLVRPFVAVGSDDGANMGSASISFCGSVIHAAAALTTAPRAEEPDDSLPLWRRRAIP